MENKIKVHSKAQNRTALGIVQAYLVIKAADYGIIVATEEESKAERGTYHLEMLNALPPMSKMRLWPC